MSSDGTESRGYDNVSLPLRKIIVNNFFGGIAWGLGSVIGATIIIGGAIWLLTQFGVLSNLGINLGNSIGDAIKNLLETVTKTR